MNLSGEHRINAPREVVWQALNDPVILRQAIPGCETVEQESPTVFTARVKAKIGPVSAVFAGRVELKDLDPPAGCVISAEGKGGAAGFASGDARITLREDGRGNVSRIRGRGAGRRQARPGGSASCGGQRNQDRQHVLQPPGRAGRPTGLHPRLPLPTGLRLPVTGCRRPHSGTGGRRPGGGPGDRPWRRCGIPAMRESHG